MREILYTVAVIVIILYNLYKYRADILNIINPKTRTQSEKIENIFMSENIGLEYNANTTLFGNGVKITLNSDKVVGEWDGGGGNIDALHLDNFSYNEYCEAKVSPAGLWMRILGISALIAILGETLFGGWSTKSWGLFGILFVANVLVFFVFVIDALFELNIFARVIRSYFSNNVYFVKIGNKSGNNLEFYVPLTEKNKLSNLEKQISELKNYISKKRQPQSAIIDNSKNGVKDDLNGDLSQNQSPNKIYKNEMSDLDKLQQLGELYKNGILTEEEFKLKKKQILEG
jgi:hypothetical protein